MSQARDYPVILAIQNSAVGPINLVGKWLTEIGFEIRTIHAYDSQQLPATVDELRRDLGHTPLAALIPLGGSMGALDDTDASWLPTERSLIRDAVMKDVPVLGICLGAQLLATSLDGGLEKAPHPEIGVHGISVTDGTDPIFGELATGGEIPSIQWHQDMVTRLPLDGKVLASSRGCSNQVFRIGDIHYGLQFHPEADPTIVAMWERKADEAYQRSERKSDVAHEVSSAMSSLVMAWEPVIKRWGAMVHALLATQPKRRSQHL